MNLITKYSIFCLVPILVNICLQIIALSLIKNIYFAIILGTVSGLLIKYYLDANYIFEYKDKKASNFLKYSIIGAFITPIWWIFELLAHSFFANEIITLLFAFIGLVLCYYLKYRLDKAYVFK